MLGTIIAHHTKAREHGRTAMAPTMMPRRPSEDASRPPEETGERADCSICFGVSVYKRAMLEARAPPECKGVLMNVSAPAEKIQELKERAGKPREDNFCLYGLGISAYSPEWMRAGTHMPVVRGLGVMVIHSDPEELMRRIEEHKRRKHERRRRHRHGDLDSGVDDGVEDDDDDDDIIIDLGEEDGEGGASEDGADRTTEDGSALLEKGPLGSMPGKPRMPPVLPTMSFEEVVSRSVDGAKAMTNAMYNFWARRLDGFGDRYEDSCRRIVAQMEKQLWGIPNSAKWVHRKVKEIEEQIRGGRDSGQK